MSINLLCRIWTFPWSKYEAYDNNWNITGKVPYKTKQSTNRPCGLSTIYSKNEDKDYAWITEKSSQTARDYPLGTCHVKASPDNPFHDW